MGTECQPPGRLRKAPETVIAPGDVKAIFREGQVGRRDTLRAALAAALAATAAPAVRAQAATGAQAAGAAQPQLLLLWWNRPALALFMPAIHASAAVIHTNFISSLLNPIGRAYRT